MRGAYYKTDDSDFLVDKDESIVPRGSWTYDGDYFTFVCPCGCKRVVDIRAGLSEKPAKEPSWQFDGNYESATLHPSVNIVGHWHGWLRNGWWEQA